MKRLSTIAISALTAVATVATTAIPALAQRKSNYQHHIILAQAVRSTGVNYKINPAECWSKSAYGWYWAYHNEFVVCQEGKQQVGVEARWTEEDLDTVRHEAQHLIQDCMDGSRQGALGSVYKEPIELAKNVLGDKGIRSILKAYSEASDHTKVMELEAFSVATLNDPLEQVKDIRNFCF
jgi:hypothetical protein